MQGQGLSASANRYTADPFRIFVIVIPCKERGEQQISQSQAIEPHLILKSAKQSLQMLTSSQYRIAATKEVELHASRLVPQPSARTKGGVPKQRCRKPPLLSNISLHLELQ